MHLRLLYIILSLSFLPFTIHCNQKQREIDSLLAKVKDSKTDTSKITLFFEAGNLYKNNVYDSALYFYHLALSASIRAGQAKYASVCLISIGDIYQKLGIFDKALQFYLASLKIKEKIKDKKGISNSLNFIGILYSDQGFYEKALEYYNKSLKIEKELGDKYGMATIYNNIGVIYFFQGKYDDALEEYIKSLQIVKALKLKNEIITCYINIGIICTDQAMILSDKNRAMYKYNQAMEYFTNALNISKEINNKTHIANVLINMSDLYIKLGEYNRAVECSIESLQNAKEAGALLMQSFAYNNLAVAYDSLHNYKKAYQNFRLFKQINDVVFNAEKSKQINDMGVKYETEKKEQEITLLKKEKEIQMAEIKQNRIFNGVFICGIVFIIGFFSLTYYNYRERQKGRMKSELLKQQEIYTKNIIDAQEDERRRIAQDLHDGIGQKISSLKMTFQKCMSDVEDFSDPNKEKYHIMLETIDETYKEIRTISHLMMPLSLQEGGLVMAVHELIDRTFYGTGISCSFGEFHSEGIPDTISVTLYRILQELLNNIIKHADARNISVQLLKTTSNLVLIVEDDGVGLKNDFTIKEGIGLQNIVARANVFGGSFTIEPGYIKGTIATVRIPCMLL